MDINGPMVKQHCESITAQFESNAEGLAKLAKRCAYAELRLVELLEERDKIAKAEKDAKAPVL